MNIILLLKKGTKFTIDYPDYFFKKIRKSTR